MQLNNTNMEIKTKFNVDYLLSRKHDVMPDDVFTVLEVMEILTETCYTATQIFYLCRLIKANKEFEKPYDKSSKYTWVIGHKYGVGDNSLCWKKYREDELILCPIEYLKIISGK